jgi:hypothetical protein
MPLIHLGPHLATTLTTLHAGPTPLLPLPPAERRPLAHRLRSLSEPEDVYRVYKDRQGGIQGVTSDSEIMRQVGERVGGKAN